jgi:hypothetical protein
LKLREALVKGDDDTLIKVNAETGEDVRLEVRWLYRAYEIPGAGKSISPSRSKTQDMEEVFETDHIDSCTADSILSPVVLHENQQPVDKLSDISGGLPCIHYHCSRFWSLHRKSFVPSGSHSNRIERGRMHSGFFGKHGTAKAALGCFDGIGNNDNQSLSDRRNLPWEEVFQSAIKALSLAEAAQDAQLRGKKLPCRDNERKEISKFLRRAICGKQQSLEGGLTESVAPDNIMFIGGAPGTGECICSIICFGIITST